MRSACFALSLMVTLAVSGRMRVASAQEPCCCPHPVLRATAILVRGAVRVVTAPVRLLVHHHGCGCDDGCCYDVPIGYGYGGEVAGPINPGITYSTPFAASSSLAIYTPVIDAEQLDKMSDEECRLGADEAIGRGLSLYRRGEISVARQYFHEATVLSPGMASAWGLCGVAAAAVNDQRVAALCAVQVREIIADNAGERSSLYRTLTPMQGNSRAAFEQLVRHNDALTPVENLVSAE